MMFDLTITKRTSTFRMLMQEERYKNSCENAVLQPMAFTTDKGIVYDRNYERTTGYKKSFNHNVGCSKSNNYLCGFCKIKGHSIQRCFKIYGYPNGNGKKVATNIQTNKNEECNTPKFPTL